MGLLDEVIGGALGSLGGARGGNGGGSLPEIVLQLINSPQVGGLPGLVEAFRNRGLGDVVDSWVGTSQNLPVSPEQLQATLGNEPFGAIAGQLGISREQAGGQLAELLPQVIDMLTPEGRIPQGGDLLTQGLEALKGRFLG